MTLYVRADVASVSLPATSGGCGQAHTRPVVDGAPVHVKSDGSLDAWPLTCPQCESVDSPQGLRSDIQRSGMKKVRTQNMDAGMKLQDRYLGLFGSSPETVPESPDQEKRREHMEQKNATEQAVNNVTAAQQTAASMNSIAAAIQGNSALMTKFMAFQAELLAQHQPVIQGEVEQSEPRQYEYPVGGLPLMADCQECGSAFARTSNKGPAPKRCPDCKAKAAA